MVASLIVITLGIIIYFIMRNKKENYIINYFIEKSKNEKRLLFSGHQNSHRFLSGHRKLGKNGQDRFHKKIKNIMI
jgi:hypothetical protein